MRRMALWLLLALALAGCRQEDDGSTAEDMVANVVTTERPSPPAGPSEQPAATKGFWDTATLTPDGGPATGAFWPTASPAATATGAATATPTAVGEVSPTPPSPVACGGRPAGWFPQPIQPGDTVGALAACVGASVGEVLAANCLTANDPIFAGGTLWLPHLCELPTPMPPLPSPVPTLDTGIAISSPEPPPPGPGKLAADPTEVAPWQPVDLVLSGFTPESVVTLTFEDADLEECDTRTVKVDAFGNQTYTLFVPGNFPSGYISVKATDANDRRKSATGGFTVIGSTAPGCGASPATPTAEATPTPEATSTPEATPTAETTPTPEATPLPEPSATPLPDLSTSPTPDS